MGESTAVHSVEVMVVPAQPMSARSHRRGSHPLKRSLGYWDLVLYGLAYIAPFAPLTTLGFVWDESNGLIVLAYALGGVCMYFTARSYATMTEVLPTAGSVYGFARHCLGAFPGFIAGWMILLDYLLIPAFVYVLIAVALETLLPGVDRGVWIVLLALATTCVNWFGITVTSRANFIAVATSGAGTGRIHGALPCSRCTRARATARLTLKPLFDATHFNAGKIFGATSICIMSFLGFDAVSTLAEEVEGGDRRVVGRAIIAMLMLSAVFFVALTWVLGQSFAGHRHQGSGRGHVRTRRLGDRSVDGAWCWRGPTPSWSACRMRCRCRSASRAWYLPWAVTGRCRARWRASIRATAPPTWECWSPRRSRWRWRWS